MLGDRKSLPIAKNHPKPSQESSEQIGLFLFTKIRVLVGIHTEKFTRTSPKTWEDKFLGIPFSSPNMQLDSWGSKRQGVLALFPAERSRGPCPTPEFTGDMASPHKKGLVVHPANQRRPSLNGTGLYLKMMWILMMLLLLSAPPCGLPMRRPSIKTEREQERERERERAI